MYFNEASGGKSTTGPWAQSLHVSALNARKPRTVTSLSMLCRPICASRCVDGPGKPFHLAIYSSTGLPPVAQIGTYLQTSGVQPAPGCPGWHRVSHVYAGLMGYIQHERMLPSCMGCSDDM